jgi:hypothetical protein
LLADIAAANAREKHYTADGLPVILVNENGLCASRERGSDNLFPPFPAIKNRTVAVVSLTLDCPARQPD